MTINGHSTTELDYSCHHLRMLYNKEHMKTKDDLYEIGNYPRSHVKQSVNIALNSTSRRKAKLAILKALRDNDTSIQKEYVEKLFQAVFQKHFAISKYFFIGCGMGLQFHDSCIAMDIINQFTRNGQIVLSVHDSFICESSNEEKLWQLMTACYEKRFQFPPVIKKK